MSYERSVPRLRQGRPRYVISDIVIHAYIPRTDFIYILMSRLLYLSSLYDLSCNFTKDIKSYNNYNITLDPIITISTSL